MSLIKEIKAETSINGVDITIKDLSKYDSTTPKSDFDTRKIRFTFSDGEFVDKLFPYDNVNNDEIDTITYETILSKDSILNVDVEFVYKDEEVESEHFIFNYLSNILSLKCRSNLANAICDCEDCDSELRILNKIDSNIESASYAAIFDEPTKCQKFLDANTEICNSLKNKNCKSC